MRTQEQESRPFSLSLWMDEESAASAADDLIPLDVLERGFADEQPVEEVPPHSPTQWAYLHRPADPLVDGNSRAGA